MSPADAIAAPYDVGIDLGTSYCAAAASRQGQISAVELGSRSALLPSVVYLGRDGRLVAGEAAGRFSLTEPDRVGREVKRRLGDATPIVLGGSPLAPEMVLGTLLRTVLQKVIQQQGGPPSAVCVTCPANWGGYRRDLFDQVLRIAGRPDALVIPEPVAAAAWYSRRHRWDDGEARVIYDFGGGTFDAVAVARHGDGFAVLGEAQGLEHVGGADLDAAVMQLIDEALDGALGRLDPDDLDAMRTMAQVRAEAVAAKESLSIDTAATVAVPLPSGWVEVRITRGEFDERIRPVVLATIDCLRTAIDEAGGVTAVREVLLVGGSSNVPLVSQLIAGEIGVPIAVSDDPKRVVALGAALLAADRAVLRSPAGGPPPSPVEPPPPIADDVPPEAAVAVWSPPAPAPGSAPEVAAAPRPGMSPRQLLLLSGPDGGSLVALPDGRLSLGRDPGPSGLVVRDHHASRLHAHLDVADAAVRIVDAGSLNGTVLDGETVQDTVIEPGQFLRIGSTIAVLVSPDDAPHPSVAATVARPNRTPGGGAGPGRAAPVAPGGWLRARRRDRGSTAADRSEALGAEQLRGHLEHLRRRRSAHPAAAVAAYYGEITRGVGHDAFLVLCVGFATLASTFDPDGPTAAPRRIPSRLLDADVPATISLADGPAVDITGGSTAVSGCVRHVLLDLALLHDPADVAIAWFGATGSDWWPGAFGHATDRAGQAWSPVAEQLIEQLNRDRMHRRPVVVVRGSAQGALSVWEFCRQHRIAALRYDTPAGTPSPADVIVELSSDGLVATLRSASGSGLADVLPATLGEAAAAAIAQGRFRPR